MNLASIAEATRLTRAGRLAEATAMLRGLAGAPASATPAPEPMRNVTPQRDALPSPVGGEASQFLDLRHTAPAGTIDYKLYVPAGVGAGAPLVVMLHGCTQTPDDFARGTRMNALADEQGLLVAYPAQSQRANAQRCWNWYAPDHQARDRGEPALIAGLVREVMARHAIDRDRVFVAGLSAGGAAAAVLAEAYPDLFAAVGIHSGLACGAARDVASAFGAMQNGGTAHSRTKPALPTILFHGDRDTTVNEINARQIATNVSTGTGLTVRSERGTSPGGRRFTRAISTDTAGRALLEQWTIHGAGHAWSGGDAAGSYTDPTGPDASREMLRFFLANTVG